MLSDRTFTKGVCVRVCTHVVCVCVHMCVFFRHGGLRVENIFSFLKSFLFFLFCRHGGLRVENLRTAGDEGFVGRCRAHHVQAGMPIENTFYTSAVSTVL